MIEFMSEGWAWATATIPRRVVLLLTIVVLAAWVLAALFEVPEPPQKIEGYFDGFYFTGQTIIDNRNKIDKDGGCQAKYCFYPAQILFRGNITYGEERIKRQFDNVILEGNFDFASIEVSPATVPSWLKTSGAFRGVIRHPGAGFGEWIEKEWLKIFEGCIIIFLLVYYNRSREKQEKSTVYYSEIFDHYLGDEWKRMQEPDIFPFTEGDDPKSTKVVALCKHRITESEVPIQIILNSRDAYNSKQSLDWESYEDLVGLPSRMRREARQEKGLKWSDDDIEAVKRRVREEEKAKYDEKEEEKEAKKSERRKEV